MSYRTASTSQSRQTLLDLQRIQQRLGQNQTRLSTGNRLTSPGDDPAAAASILDFGNSIETNNQSIKQADSALSFLISSENVVSAAVNAVMRLKELTVSGSSASVPELESIRSTLLSLANTQSQGKYLFAGTNTLTQPFTDGSPVSYNGTAGLVDSGDINLDVSTSMSVTTNLRGDAVFLGGKDSLPGGANAPGNSQDVFQVIKDLEADLSGAGSASATTDANLDAVFKNLLQAQADLGGRQAGLLNLKDTLSGFNVTLQGLQDAQQNTDYPQAMTDFTQDQTMQSVTLNTLAKSNQSNLFDYMG